MTEAQEQKAIFDWTLAVRSTYPALKLLYHIPNGGRRDKIEAAHLKAQGVKKGVPDLCLPVARDRYHGLYIELKTETGRTRPEQRWWLEELMNQGYYATACHGWQAAVKTPEWYLRL
ncbi:MAG: VRR-NUC domain-containing protein [Clostridiales bacterium]|nr:VRR-NUC domain-containing protein [Clostridiales bacterium]